MATAFPSDDDEEGIPKYPLRIFHDRDTSDVTHGNDFGNRRSRGRSRGRGQGRGRDRRPSSCQRYVDTSGETNSEGGLGRNHRYRRGQSDNVRRNGRGSTRGTSDNMRHERPREEPTGPPSTTVRTITKWKLDSLSKYQDPDSLLQEIAPSKSGFADLLRSEIQPELLYNILRILSTATKSSQSKSLIHVLVEVERSFIKNLNGSLGDICLRSELYRSVWGNTKSLSNVCLMTLTILEGLLQTIRDSRGKCKCTLTNIKEIMNEFDLPEEDESLQEKFESVDNFIRIIMEERVRVHQGNPNVANQRHKRKEKEGMPPDDFRELSVLPAVRDVQLDEKPFLRANRSKGRYEDLNTYLDIQFRLLREDFMQPLRTGISEYIQSISSSKSENKIREIRLYKNVQIVRPVCTPDGINYVIQFDNSKMKRINWAASRRLLYGSLLCLSSDNFQTIYYATVKDRNDKDLNEGLLRVYFETMPDTSMSDTFLMAESASYFEAFRHVLTGLQSTDSSLPFQRYIVECNPEIKPPSYLLRCGVPFYDFNSILLSHTSNVNFAEIPVLNKTRWPKSTDIGLDTSQYEALQLALTKEMAIIQGPPGTGKTFIGLKIAKVLIANNSHWKPNKKGSPILVVCFTNHALDQFLEGVLTFCKDKIVRVGGRCKSEALEQYILRNLKRTRSRERKRTWGILQLEKDCLRSMGSYQHEIHSVSSELKKSYTEIIPYERLKTQMTSDQQFSFEDNMEENREKIIYQYGLV